MCSPVDSSSFGSSAALPFLDELSNTRGLARSQIDKDRKDGRTIQKVQVPVSVAGTAPHKGSVRGRVTYCSSAPRGYGVVAEISPFCECLKLCVFLFVLVCLFVCLSVCLFVCLFLGIRCCGVWHMQCLRALCGHTPLCT